MKIDLKQMSVNNTAEANLWLEQSLNEIPTRASCQWWYWSADWD